MASLVLCTLICTVRFWPIGVRCWSRFFLTFGPGIERGLPKLMFLLSGTRLADIVIAATVSFLKVSIRARLSLPLFDHRLRRSDVGQAVLILPRFGGHPC
jgi:hypothetical protein